MSNGKHYQIPATHILARPVQKPLPIYVAGHTEAMFRAAARRERSTEILPDLPLPAIPPKMTKMVVEL
jgi:hypothetical protein